MCIDYRKLNLVMKKDAFLLPRIDDLLKVFGRATWFSSLDLLSRYWQVCMKDLDQEKTAFAFTFGIYEFLVMPFGLCNAPATFQHLMNQVLADFLEKFIVVYLNDIIIFSTTFEEHVTHLTAVFNRLKNVYLKLNLDKCSFFKPYLQFLGHIIGREGIHPDSGKINKVQNFSIPLNVRQLRSFLGLASYYRKFITKFALIARTYITC